MSDCVFCRIVAGTEPATVMQRWPAVLAIVDGDGVGTGAGLIGHTYGAVKDVGIYATGEAARGLAQLEANERDRCVRFAKTAHDMGIAEREVRLAEQQGSILADVIRRVLDALDLTAGQQARVPEVVPRELRAVTVAGGPGP